MLIVSIPLFAYPRHLPDFLKHQMERKQENSANSRLDNEYGNSITDFPRAARELIVNKIYIFTVLAATAEALVANGFAPFLPKFIQSQFSITSSSASLISGIVVVPGAGGGMILVSKCGNTVGMKKYDISLTCILIIRTKLPLLAD